MLAGNDFPPSGEAPSAIERASSLAIPILILLVTCTNVSALLAGLAIARRHEIAVRLTLGAARRRIVRQLVTESILLAMAAGALALIVIGILLRLVESSIAEMYVVIDWRVVLFTIVIAVFAGIIFGLSPALHGTRVPLSNILKDAAGSVVGSGSRLQSSLVVAHLALTQPLLLGMAALVLEAIESEQRNALTRGLAGIAGTGALALFLSGIGLYAVVAFAVRQRAREIGIRAALGANRQQVVRLFVMRGLRLSVAGMLVGLTLSLIVVKLMAALKGEAPPSGLLGLAVAIAAIAITVTVVATWIPSRRAAAIDPCLVLRAE